MRPPGISVMLVDDHAMRFCSEAFLYRATSYSVTCPVTARARACQKTITPWTTSRPSL